MVLLRVTSYNMRQGGSYEHWAKILSATEPDLLFVQETKDPTTFSGDPLEPLNLRHVLWRSAAQNTWGSAVLYRGGEIAEIPVPEFTGWVTGGETQIDGEPAFLFSVHLPRLEGSYLKTGHRLMDELAPILDGATCIIGGDWNFTACLRDQGDPRGHKRGEVEFIHRMADDFGLVPSWRIAHPEGELPQTLRWMREPRTPYHCDGIFVPSRLSRRPMLAKVHSGTPWLNLSDHNPIEVEWSGPLNVGSLRPE
jgi:endonuclease/exonuclease/phosphatase family metal-dependent hydrolase